MSYEPDYYDLYDCPVDFFEDVTVADDNGVITTIPGPLMKEIHIKAYELSKRGSGLTPDLETSVYGFGLQFLFDRMYHGRHAGAIIDSRK